eukprot:5665303-Prymnesium_polylepis.1
MRFVSPVQRSARCRAHGLRESSRARRIGILTVVLGGACVDFEQEARLVRELDTLRFLWGRTPSEYKYMQNCLYGLKFGSIGAALRPRSGRSDFLAKVHDVEWPCPTRSIRKTRLFFKR